MTFTYVRVRRPRYRYDSHARWVPNKLIAVVT